MKRMILSMRAVLLILMLGWAGSAFAYDFTIDGIHYTVDSVTLEATVTGMNSQEINPCVVIPETVAYEGTTYTVTAIASHSLSLTSVITDLIVPNTVRTIGDYVCWMCHNLKRVYIGSGVQSIGEYVTLECKNLESLEVHPDNPYYDSRGNCNAIIGTATNTLFYGCKNTVFPDDITEIGHSAFYNVTTPENVVIPNSVTKIGTISFYNALGMKSMTLGSGVVDMEYNPFSICPDLEALSVHPDNPRFDSRNGCNAIIETQSNKLVAACRNTIIPEDIVTIGQWAYLGCKGLDRIVIPASVTLVEPVAFAESDVQRVTFPGTCKKIDYGVFDLCYNLSEVIFEDGVTTLGEMLFRNCGKLKRLRLPNTITEIPDDFLWQCDGLNEFIIPNSVVKVGANATLHSPNILRLVIGSGVREIGPYAFVSCGHAKTITCLAPTPPDISGSAISQLWKTNTVLRVPRSALDNYRLWAQFFLEVVGVNDDGSAGPGDSDGDGSIGINDAIMIIDAILSGDTSSVIVENADLNGNGRLDIGDVATLIDMILHP